MTPPPPKKNPHTKVLHPKIPGRKIPRVEKYPPPPTPAKSIHITEQKIKVINTVFTCNSPIRLSLTRAESYIGHYSL